MVIDINLLNQKIIDEIEIDEDIEIESTTSDIKKLNNLHVNGNITQDSLDNFDVNIELTGEMIIVDSITLEDIAYPFVCKIDEKIEKNKENYTNTLDLSELLWQNIVLEVPLRFTKVDSLDEFKGEGWQLLSEDELTKSNNPFEEIKSMFGEE